jgi:hypothetical protein
LPDFALRRAAAGHHPPMPSKPLRAAHLALAFLFFYAASLQFNDTDATAWIVMYVTAAVPCVLVALGHPRRRLAVGVGALAALWAGVYLVRGAWRVPPSAMFAEWTMSNDSVREARELYGLLLIAVAMFLSVWLTRGGVRK